MAHFQHQGDRAVVSFSGELTVDAAVDLVETIEMLASVYFYAVVELVLADHEHPPATTNAEFFDREGASLLIVVVAFVLMLIDRRAPPARPPRVR